MQDFRKLKVWRKAHELTLAVHVATRDLPSSEAHRLGSQMRRAAGSIGANIAEGCGREAGPSLARLLQRAMGSANELENHTLLARDLKLLRPENAGDVMKSTTEVKRLLASLISKVRITDKRK